MKFAKATKFHRKSGGAQGPAVERFVLLTQEEFQVVPFVNRSGEVPKGGWIIAPAVT